MCVLDASSGQVPWERSERLETSKEAGGRGLKKTVLFASVRCPLNFLSSLPPCTSACKSRAASGKRDESTDHFLCQHTDL
jgi:hypothetical protein